MDGCSSVQPAVGMKNGRHRHIERRNAGKGLHDHRNTLVTGDESRFMVEVERDMMG